MRRVGTSLAAAMWLLLASSLALLAPAEAEVTIKLNGPLPIGSRVAEDLFLISPDSSRVVYQADQDTLGVLEIFTQSPAQVTQNLIDDVGSLVDASTLTAEQGDGATAKLEAAIASQDKGNTNAACNQLRALINQTNAFINDGTLTSTEGQILIDAANVLRNEFGCR